MTTYIKNLLGNIVSEGGLKEVLEIYQTDDQSGSTIRFLSYVRTYIRSRHVNDMKGGRLGHIIGEISYADCNFAGGDFGTCIRSPEPVDALRDIVTSILAHATLKILSAK